MNEFDQAAAQMLQDTDPMDIAAGQLVDDQRAKTRASLYSSLLQNPDVAARATALGKRVGLPGSLVQRNLSEVERRVRMDDFDRVLDGSPALAKWLADQNNAAVAHDNVENMGALERTLSGVAEAAKYVVSAPGQKNTLAGDVGAGFFDASRGAAGLFQAPIDLVAPVLDPLESVTAIGGNPLRRLSEGFGMIGAGNKAKAAEMSPASGSIVQGGISSGVRSLVGNTLSLPMAVLSPAAALAGMSAQAGGSAYQDAREKGIPVGTAIPFAASQAAIEYATEKIPVSKLVGDLAQNTGIMRMLGGQIAAEVPGEQVATVLQDLNEWAILNPQKPFSEYLKERPSAAAQTLIATAVGVGGNVAVMSSIDSALYGDQKRTQKAQEAELGAQVLLNIQQLAAADKLLQRDPESFQQFIDQAAQDGPVDTVYIDAKTLMQSGLAEQVAQVSPAVAEQLELAAQTGAQIAIPVGEYTARIAPTDFAQGLLEHLKTDPDGFTVAEAREYQQSGADQQFQQEVERTLAEKQGDTLFNASRDAVQMKIQQELDALGRFTPEKNAADAVLFASYYATRAAQLGVTPEALYDQRRVKFAAESVAGQQFQQGAATSLDAVRESWSSAGIKHSLLEDGDTITVSQIVVPEDARGAGVGTKAMQDLIAYADATGKHVVLSPSEDFGGNKKRLTSFYKRFGFVENKGKNRAFSTSESMYRQAQGKVLYQPARGSFGRIFNAMRDGQKVGEVVALEQDAAQAAAVQKFGDGVTAEPTNDMLVSLLKGADLSTALHEGAHFFFENDIALAAELVREQVNPETQTEGERQIVADVSKLLKWHGISGTIEEQLATWYGMDFEAKRAAHERTAESFERYLFEGNAPSVELAAYFLKFRAWMVNVYKSIKDFLARNPEAGKLDDTVRGVFDRMLATAEQVKMAEQGRSMLPLFASPDQGGMTPEEFAAYQAQGVEATAEAIHKLEARTLRDLAWARNARGREITKLQKKAAGLRKEVRMEARREIMSQPVYRAWQFLTGRAETLPLTPEQQAARDEHRLDMVDWEQRRSEHKAEKTRELRDQAWEASDQSKAEYETPQKRGMAKGQFLMRNRREIELSAEQSAVQWEKFNPKPKAPEIAREDGQNVQNGEVGKLQLSEVESMGLPDDVIASLIDRKMTAKSDGWHPDPLAEEFGFGSGDEMVRALAAAEPPASVIESLTDRMMMERHGELATQEAIELAADQAIHNEARARMVATEANALAQAAGQRKVLADAAKQFAAQVVARLKVRDVKPSRFSNAAARAAQNAEKASRAGDIATAAAEKRNQMVQTYAAKAAHDTREEVEASVGYLKKFDRKSVRENLDAGYLDQIDALLDRYDLSLTASAADRRASLRTWVQSRLNAGEIPAISEFLLTPDERAAYLAEVQSRDETGELVYKDDEEAIKLLADAIDRSAQRSYKDMTVEEFRGLVDTVKNIEHLARLKNKLLSQREERAYEAVRDEMADAIVQNASKSGKNTPTATDWLGRSFQAVKDFGASHIKVATWARIMDGGQDNGPVWRYLVQPANERSTMETTMRAEATERLSAILDPILNDVPTSDKWGKGRHFPTLGRALNWQQRFAVALNVGNESNLQRLLGGDGWTYAQILPVLNSLSAKEWQAVQAVWDHFETYRPLIAAKEKRVTGTEPEWIQARPITVATADGQTVTLPGGYFPVVFDPRVNMKAEADSKSQEFKDLAKAAYSAATTRRGFTKQRVQELNGRPLMLSLQGLYTATNDVIHDLAWHEWVIDANKLLKSKTIDNAIREHYGPEVKRQFEKWRDDIVMGPRRMDHSVERAVGFLRQSVSASALTFNLLSAAQQPLGMANSVARVGAKWIGRGVARYVSAPFESTSEAMEKSAWLRNRTRTRFRELNELRNQVQGQTTVKELAGRYGYWLMMRTQLMVDVPTWWGAYEKAIADGQDEATAVQLADQSVKDAQGGGEEVDLAGIERGNALTKVFTTFYSYMGSTLNVAYLAGKTDASRARAVANILLVTMTPAILGTLLKDALIPGGDDDEEKLTKKLLAEQISFLMGMVVVGREFAQAGKMLAGDGGMAYSGPGGLRVIGDATKLAQQTAQGEFDEGFLRAFISVTGGLTGLPAVQINRTLQGAAAVNDGQTDGAIESAAALAFGMQR